MILGENSISLDENEILHKFEIMFEVEGDKNTAKVMAKNIEKGAITQIKNLCDQDFAKDSKIRLMPDAHAGAGCVVGTTMTITDKIVPDLVGVDIGCGVEAVNIGPDPFDPAELDNVIRNSVPSGFAIRDDVLAIAEEIDLSRLSCFSAIAPAKALKAIGTLGGGNHFIEVSRGSNGDNWLIIHSGSKNTGLQVANWHQKIAQQIRSDVPPDLAWLDGEKFERYVADMKLMQKYAQINRQAMTIVIMEGMGWKERDRFTTIHNYLDTENMILRKGAVSAQKGERLLVPINMRDGSLLCEGLGNPDWNFSAPHGAGRLMSRGEAKRNLSMDEFKDQMAGIYSTSITEETLDEAPNAYKPMADILEAIKDTAKVHDILKPVYNFKAVQTGGKRRKRH